MLENHERWLTKEERSAIDYFHGKGIYKKWQHFQTPPNLLDTRKSFLKKMENKKMRDKFLECYNREHFIEES